MESTEKIYCYDRDNSALMAALMNNHNNNGFETAALLNGGMCGANAMWNNPMMYLVWLAVLGNGGLFGNNRGCGAATELNGRFDSIQAQIDTNHNNDVAMQAINGNHNAIHELAGILNTSFQSVATGICDIRSAIKEVGGQVGYSAERVINAANVGDMNIIAAIKDCCCQTQQNVIKMGYDNQLGQKDLQAALSAGHTQLGFNIQQGFDRTNTGLERGFSSVAYEAQRQTCDIINSGKDNTQRIIDTLNNHWSLEKSQALQDAKFEISQLKQNQYLISNLGGCSCNC